MSLNRRPKFKVSDTIVSRGELNRLSKHHARIIVDITSTHYMIRYTHGTINSLRQSYIDEDFIHLPDKYKLEWL